MRWPILLALLLCACATVPTEYPKNVLAFQVLHPMPGHKGLVNAHCKPNLQTKTCDWSYDEYDLTDAKVRQELRDLKIVCRVNDEIYRPALEKTGLIRETYIPGKCAVFNWFCQAPVEQELDFIDISETKKLIDARTVCFSFPNYPLETFLRK